MKQIKSGKSFKTTTKTIVTVEVTVQNQELYTLCCRSSCVGMVWLGM